MSSHSPDSGVSRPVHPLYTEYALDECEYVPDLCQTSDEIVAMDDPERLQACFARHSGWGSGRLAVVRGSAVGGNHCLQCGQDVFCAVACAVQVDWR